MPRTRELTQPGSGASQTAIHTIYTLAAQEHLSNPKLTVMINSIQVLLTQEIDIIPMRLLA